MKMTHHSDKKDGMPNDTANANEAMKCEYEQALWAHFINLILAVWLITSPFTLGYQSAGLTWSDCLSGVFVLIFSLLSYWQRFSTYARWANCFVGIWLLFAPLVYWAPASAAYVNDTVVGALLIVFAVLIPGMPGMDMSAMNGPDIPPGWSYNPSTWMQRAPIILLAAIGYFASRYMAAYQLGHINQVWDPFFGDGTRRVLESDVSKMFPISDAGLGAVSYLLEMLMGFMGDRARWRTMPWMVMFFGILVVPLGVISIVLIVLQPLAVESWCSLCLIAGIAMLVMVPATLDEVVAMLQFLLQARRQGKPLWRTFWKGGVLEGGGREEKLTPFNWSQPFEMFHVWLASNWNLIASTAIGLWLMFAPSLFGTQARAADNDHLIGALIITFSVIATAEVGRALRFVNTLFGAWIIIAPWLLSGSMGISKWINLVAGMALILLSLSRGRVRASYGKWQPYIV